MHLFPSYYLVCTLTAFPPTARPPPRALNGDVVVVELVVDFVIVAVTTVSPSDNPEIISVSESDAIPVCTVTVDGTLFFMI